MKKPSSLILIVDDSKDNQSLLKILLNSHGHQVYCVSNGKEAICLLQELDILPDLILLDAQMPIMDGYQFRLQQKINARIRDIPVVVMTADDHQDMNERMNFPSGVLLKPLNLKLVIDTVSAHC